MSPEAQAEQKHQRVCQSNPLQVEQMGGEKKIFLRRQVCQVAGTPQQETVDTATAGRHPRHLPTRGSGYASALGGTGAQKETDIQRFGPF